MRNKFKNLKYPTGKTGIADIILGINIKPLNIRPCGCPLNQIFRMDDLDVWDICWVVVKYDNPHRKRLPVCNYPDCPLRKLSLREIRKMSKK